MARSTSRRRDVLSMSSRPSRLIRLFRESRRAWSTEMGVKAGHKPGSVHASEEGGWLSIWDRRYRRPRAARLDGTGPMASRRSLALLPAGVYRASTSRCCWCALTAPLHPCLCRRTGHRRCVSVALSSRSPALGVTQQAWPSGSPDFPQPTLKEIGRNHLACFQISSCLVGIIQGSGAVAQLDRATVS